MTSMCRDDGAGLSHRYSGCRTGGTEIVGIVLLNRWFSQLPASVWWHAAAHMAMTTPCRLSPSIAEVRPDGLDASSSGHKSQCHLAKVDHGLHGVPVPGVLPAHPVPRGHDRRLWHRLGWWLAAL